MQRLNLGRFLIGKPLETKELPHQSISKPIGLAVFASDALSSSAYATQEMLIILAMAGGVAGNSLRKRILIKEYMTRSRAYEDGNCSPGED